MGIKSLPTFLKKEEQHPAAEYEEEEVRNQNSIHYYIDPRKKRDDDAAVLGKEDEFMGSLFNNNDEIDDDEGDEPIPEMKYWEWLMMPCDYNSIESSTGNCRFELEDSEMRFPEEYFGGGGFKKEPAEWENWEEDQEDDEKKKSLNLSLNYQGVLDAWSDRTLWADSPSFPTTSNDGYLMGSEGMTVPMAVEEEGEEGRKRREARVLRYKEKRQTRLFSKKIRYQVRKLNADNRPRLKGRFVKRAAEKMHK